MTLGRPFKAGTNHDNCTRRVATPESSPQVTLIVVDIVFLQQLQILILKSLLTVMLALVPDVCNHIWDLGLADREPTVTVLPFKATELEEFLMNPLGRLTFQVLGDLAGTMRRQRHHESMNMIFDSSDLKGSHLVMSGDATDVGPNAIFDFFCEPRFPILGAEREMIMQGCIGICHGSFLFVN